MDASSNNKLAINVFGLLLYHGVKVKQNRQLAFNLWKQIQDSDNEEHNLLKWASV